MIERLPHWIIPNKIPAFLEGESATAIEMVAKVYGKTNELIADYNEFVNAVNQHIDEFETSTEKNYELFTVGIRQEFQDFIDTVELKIMEQDKEIQDAVAYMKNNLTATMKLMISNMFENGGITLKADYDSELYSLELNINYLK